MLFEANRFYSVIIPGRAMYALKTAEGCSDLEIRYSYLCSIQIAPAPGNSVSTITIPLGAVCGQDHTPGVIKLSTAGVYVIQPIDESSSLYQDLIQATSGIKLPGR